MKTLSCRWALVVVTALAVSACGSAPPGDDGGTGGSGGSAGGGSGGSAGGGSGGGGGYDCTQHVTTLNGSGGCRLQIVSPANCTVYPASQEYVTIEYSTDGSFCEGPHHLFLLGHPQSTWETNGTDVTLNSSTSPTSIGSASSYTMSRNIGGTVTLWVPDIKASATSANGQYHVAVTGFYAIDNGGSRSASITFIVPP